MTFFLLQDCTIDDATPIWLLLTLAALVIAGIVLLAQTALLWRRETLTGYPWWRCLPLALLVLLAVVCGLLATLVLGYYRDVTTPSTDPFGVTGLCIPIAHVYGEARFVVALAAIAIAVSWFALARISRARAS